MADLWRIYGADLWRIYGGFMAGGFMADLWRADLWRKGGVWAYEAYEVKKEGKNLLRHYIAGEKKLLFYIYAVIVKQKNYKRSTNYY